MRVEEGGLRVGAMDFFGGMVNVAVVGCLGD